MQVCKMCCGSPQICPLYSAPEASTAFVTSPMAFGSGDPRFVKLTPSGELANSPGDCHDGYRTPPSEMASDGSLPSSLPGSCTGSWKPSFDPAAVADPAATSTATSAAAREIEAVLERMPSSNRSSRAGRKGAYLA